MIRHNGVGGELYRYPGPDHQKDEKSGPRVNEA